MMPGTPQGGSETGGVKASQAPTAKQIPKGSCPTEAMLHRTSTTAGGWALMPNLSDIAEAALAPALSPQSPSRETFGGEPGALGMCNSFPRLGVPGEAGQAAPGSTPRLQIPPPPARSSTFTNNGWATSRVSRGTSALTVSHCACSGDPSRDKEMRLLPSEGDVQVGQADQTQRT